MIKITDLNERRQRTREQVRRFRQRLKQDPEKWGSYLRKENERRKAQRAAARAYFSNYEHYANYK